MSPQAEAVARLFEVETFVATKLRSGLVASTFANAAQTDDSRRCIIPSAGRGASRRWVNVAHLMRNKTLIRRRLSVAGGRADGVVGWPDWQPLTHLRLTPAAKSCLSHPRAQPGAARETRRHTIGCPRLRRLHHHSPPTMPPSTNAISSTIRALSISVSGRKRTIKPHTTMRPRKAHASPTSNVFISTTFFRLFVCDACFRPREAAPTGLRVILGLLGRECQFCLLPHLAAT
jgi:hypothetical protein